jgi:uncharacterized protein DUF5681
MPYDPACDPASHDRSYNVGYGKPPLHTRFQKGRSGNPGGRPRGSGTERVKQLALDEAYREVAVGDDGEAATMPAIQAVIRAQLALAAEGNGPAQRAVLKMVQEIETERAAVEAEEAARRTTYQRRLAEQEEPDEKDTQAAEVGTQAAEAARGPPMRAGRRRAAARPRRRRRQGHRAKPRIAPPIPEGPTRLSHLRRPPVTAAGQLAVTIFFKFPVLFPVLWEKRAS